MASSTEVPPEVLLLDRFRKIMQTACNEDGVLIADWWAANEIFHFARKFFQPTEE
jgi:hypothetical protein